MTEFTAKSLLTSHRSHPLILDAWMLKNLGPEWYDWEPETLWPEAVKAAGAPNISEVVRNKLQAIRTIRANDTVFHKWEVFEKVVAALNSVVPRFDIMQKPDLGQLLLGVAAIQQLRGGAFSDEVVRYMAAVLLTDGIAYAPPPIEECNPILKQRHPSHGRVKAVIESGAEPDDEAVEAQVGEIRNAKAYAAQASERLLNQVGVVREAGSPTRLPT